MIRNLKAAPLIAISVFSASVSSSAATFGYFHVEHFVAVAEHPKLSLSYNNLLYSCQSCNLRKSSQTVPDPLKIFTSKAVTVRSDGSILGRAKDAKRLIELLRLNNPSYQKLHRKMLGTLAAAFQPVIELKAAHSTADRVRLYWFLLNAIATHRVSDRYEPRVKKHRRNHYGWLTKPRTDVKRQMTKGVTES